MLLHAADLGYESCTWENELEPIIYEERYIHLLKDFWQRHYASLERSSPNALQGYNSRMTEAAAHLPGPSAGAITDTPLAQPPHITAAPLEQHQLAGVGMLQRMYAHASDVVIADDPAMGMVATVLTFLQVCTAFHSYFLPCLVSIGLPGSFLHNFRPGGAVQCLALASTVCKAAARHRTIPESCCIGDWDKPFGSSIVWRRLLHSAENFSFC